MGTTGGAAETALVKPKTIGLTPKKTEAPPAPEVAKPATTEGTPLRFDNQTGRYNGEKLERGDILTDSEGKRYQLDRQSGFTLTVDELNEKGQPRGSKSFSVEPTDKTRYRDLFRTGENAFSEEPWYKEDHATGAVPAGLSPTVETALQEVAVQNKIAPENLEYAGDMKGMNDEPIAHLFNVTDENDPRFKSTLAWKIPPGEGPAPPAEAPPTEAPPTSTLPPGVAEFQAKWDGLTPWKD